MRNLTRNLIPVLSISAVMLLTSCSTVVQNSSQESHVSETSEVSDVGNQTEDNSEPSTIIPENNDEQKNTKLPSNYCDFKTADIPNIPQEQREIEAQGTKNVLFDTKQADDFSVLLVGNYVSTDTENYPEMVNCFDMGIALLEGETVGETYKAPAEFTGIGQGGYWLYTDMLSDYLSLYRFGENYIILFRYYDSKDNSHAAFYAVKDKVVYPCLMGDYSAIGGQQMAIVTELSENLSVNEECCTITDKDKNVVFSFDFDAIGDTFTGAHYVVNYNETTESSSSDAASETASEFPETTDKEIAINTENYNITLCYGVYSDGKITQEITLKVTDSDNNEYERQAASPALGIGPYNEIPEGYEFKLIAGETNDFPVFAVLLVPITVRGDVFYYATLYRFDGENLDLYFPEGQYGEFFPLISDVESVVINSNSLSYCDETGNAMNIEFSE